MPFYTYITTFKGASYVAQGSYGNFKGFLSAGSCSTTSAWIIQAVGDPGESPIIQADAASRRCRVRRYAS